MNTNNLQLYNKLGGDGIPSGTNVYSPIYVGEPGVKTTRADWNQVYSFCLSTPSNGTGDAEYSWDLTDHTVIVTLEIGEVIGGEGYDFEGNPLPVFSDFGMALIQYQNAAESPDATITETNTLGLNSVKIYAGGSMLLPIRVYQTDPIRFIVPLGGSLKVVFMYSDGSK